MNRPRKQFKFWLLRDDAADQGLQEYIAYLKTMGSFTQTIRDGLRLMWTLRQGDLSILFELFPTLQSQLKPDHTPLIEEIRAILLSQPMTTAAPPGIKPIAMKPITMPIFDDDADEQPTVIIKTTASAGGTANFLEAAFKL